MNGVYNYFKMHENLHNEMEASKYIPGKTLNIFPAGGPMGRILGGKEMCDVTSEILTYRP